MKLKKIDEVPKRGGWGESTKLIQEFLASGHKVVEVEFNEDRTAAGVANALTKNVRHHDAPVRVARRGGKVYLMRADA